MFLGLRGIGGVQGGVETHVTELVRHLPYAPAEMEVIGRSPYRRDDLPVDAGLPPVRWLPALRHSGLEAALHSLLGVLYAAVRRPRLLHIHGIGPNLVTPLARLCGLRVVATHHGEDYQREKWGSFARRILRFGERQAVCRAHACISVSPVVADTLRQRFDRPVRYIPNGVGAMPHVSAGQTLASHGLEPGRYIVNVARLVPEKRQFTLVEAFLAARVPGVKLVLIGGADHESDYVRSLRARVAAEPSIVMTGHVSGAPLHELIGNAGLFVLPSSHEGLPIVLLEAMSCGLRVVVSDLPVHVAMGLPADCIFPLGDIAALAEKLGAWFAAPGAAPDWTVMLRHYEWAHIAEQTAQVYRDVLGWNTACGNDLKIECR
jgi:glycosyltransferase involved in cell wall biosynthesis